MFDLDQSIAQQDPAVWDMIAAERERQEAHVELIASENYASAAVMAAQGSCLTNKYAEGYPKKRYYGGCEHVDAVELLAIERLKQLFGADYANVQPHSGSQANAAVYLALVPPGGKILGMSLDHGGHLTHGSPVNFSGRLYQSIPYGVSDVDGSMDYDQVLALAKAQRPHLIVAGFSAYSRVLDWQRFKDIAEEVGAYLMVDMAHVAGLVATGHYPSPVQIADVCTSTTHKTLRGPRGGLILAKSNPDLAKKLNSAVFPGLQGGPLMHVIAAKAVAFGEALQPSFKAYQEGVVDNAKAMAQRFTERGFEVVSGGTDNHLMLLSLIDRGLTGKAAEKRLGEAAITLNKNTVPDDPESPFVTSGLRLGTPAVTTRGYGVAETVVVTDWICDILSDMANDALVRSVREQVMALNQRFPVYGAQSAP